MPERTFMIAVDSSAPFGVLEHLRMHIRNSPKFQNWWNHIPFVFLVTSDDGAEGISADLTQHMNGARFLVMEVNPGESEGWLPEKGWNWIRRRSRSGKALSKAG